MDDVVKRARELLTKATPGPWVADRCSVQEPDGRFLLQDNVSHSDDTYSNFTERDCALIAAAPELLASLCDEVERLRGESLKGDQRPEKKLIAVIERPTVTTT